MRYPLAGRGQAAAQGEPEHGVHRRPVHRGVRVDPDRQSRDAAVRHGVHGAHAQAAAGRGRIDRRGADRRSRTCSGNLAARSRSGSVTATFAVPSASAITRSVVASNAMPTSRSAVTAASTRTPSPAARKSAIAASMLLRALAANGLRSTTALLGQRLLEIRHRGARGGAEQPERRLRLDVERDVGEPQHLARRDRAPAGPRHARSPRRRGRTSSCFSFALTRSEISSRSPEAATLDAADVTANAPLWSSGKVLPLSCASIRRLTSVNGTSIGTAMLTRPCSSLRHDARAAPGTGNPAWSRSARCGSRPARRS